MSTPDQPPPSPGPLKRNRAPTITIDTSAVSSPSPPQEMNPDAVPLRALPTSPTHLQSEPASPAAANLPSSTINTNNGSNTHKSRASGSSIPQLRTTESFESRESRPPSSLHNVSSPTSKGGFLSVPGQSSRQNSVDTDELSLTSETYVPTTPGGSGQGDRDHKMDPSKNKSVMNDPDALTPDPGTDDDFKVDDNKFAFSPGQLGKLIDPKSLSAFYALGGLKGIEKGLRTNRKSGLSSDETVLDGTVSFESVKSSSAEEPTFVANVGRPMTRSSTSGTIGRSKKKDPNESFGDRRRVFNNNRLPEKKEKTIWELLWITYNDKVLILLSIAAVVSLSVGLFQTFGTEHKDNEPRVEWVEGVAIIVAIVTVVVVGSANDYQKERQFVKLNKRKQDRNVNVIRSGKAQEVSVYDILVGDVVLLEPGDSIPADGIFIEGYNVKCDESQSTGESDLLRKVPGDEVFAAIENGEDIRKADPFILSGSQVTEGVGKFIVTATGVHSAHGKIMMSLREDPEVTPLQSKLNTLAEYIAKLGGAAGLLLFVVLFIEFLARLPHNTDSPAEKGQDFIKIFIVTVTIIVVAVPEGLPLAVTLALAFATTRMLKDNNLVRHLKACEVMGNATTICSDKTGTLTQNKMTVVAGTIGTSSRFGGTTQPQEESADGRNEMRIPKVVDDISPTEVVGTLSPDTKSLITQSVAINSTAFEGEVNGEQTFIGSKTETALLLFARDFLGMGPVSVERSNAEIVQLIPFDSKRKCMGAVVHLENGKYRLLVKGASEILLEQCTQVIRDPTKSTSSSPMSEEDRRTLNNLIMSYAQRSLRTIGMVYRDFESWPPKGVRRAQNEPNEAVFEDIFKQMIMLGIVGIQDPLRDGVKEAVAKCQKAGVVVRMVTGDNVNTARAIATECGIYTAGGLVMEGPVFRKLSKREMDLKIPQLQVLARSSPEDKRILVKRLKELGGTVAVTGDGTNDAPALKTADVGFSMGIAGTEVAKEASAIILMDDNFASIVKAMMWGRAVNDAVKKFLQFQVTVNITAVMLTFISAVSSNDETSVLTAVQLLWVNLIMDTMAALALATDPPTDSILDRKPDPKSAPLISITMWKMIIGESIYQLAVTLLLYFGGISVFSYDEQPWLVNTLVFNTFVWMQIFNQWNNRRLDNHFNIFEGMLRNYFFIGVNIVMIGGQVMIIFVGGAAFKVQPLDARGWAWSIVLGFMSIPIGAVIRLIPDELIRKLIPDYLTTKRKGTPSFMIEDEEEHFQFPGPLRDVKEELSFLKRVKGGRLNNLRFAMQHPRETFMPRSRSGSRSRSNSIPHTPTGYDGDESFGGLHPPSETRRRGRSNTSRSNSALGATAVMAGIIAGSVAGWSPIERTQGDHDSSRLPRGQGRPESDSKDGAGGTEAIKPAEPVISAEPDSYVSPPSQIPQTSPAPALAPSLLPPSTSASPPRGVRSNTR